MCRLVFYGLHTAPEGFQYLDCKLESEEVFLFASHTNNDKL
jgi:hypothetical protein